LKARRAQRVGGKATPRKRQSVGFRHPSPERRFGDVTKSRPTPAAERRIAAHPSGKNY
jgi:site-specific DNA-methyltransferase (adenine-specific)